MGSSATGTVQVREEIFTDPQSVTLIPEMAPQLVLASPRSGVLVELKCLIGGAITTGDTVAVVDGTPVPGLFTATPLWRPLEVGMFGKDVEALQRSLNNLGYSVEPDARFGRSTATALRDFRRDRGMSDDSKIDPSELIWLPRAVVSIGACTAQVGQTITAGVELMLAGPQVNAFKLESAEGASTPGRRLVSLEGIKFAVDSDSRSVADLQTIADISSTEPFKAWLESEGKAPIVATSALETGVPAYAVPASSLLSAPTGTCVIQGAETISVSVLSSTLGRVLVAPERPLKNVEVPASSTLQCD